MLWVYDHYEYFYSYSAGIDFRRQILSTEVDPRTIWVNLWSAASVFNRIQTDFKTNYINLW